MSAAEDRAEVERVLLGDISAFEGIVRRWQGPLINLAWRFCHDRGRAEEMAQETFLRTYRSLQTWRGDAAFSTWLFALATNLYRTELRRIPQHTVPLDEVSEPMDLRVASSGIEEEPHNRSFTALRQLFLRNIVMRSCSSVSTRWMHRKQHAVSEFPKVP